VSSATTALAGVVIGAVVAFLGQHLLQRAGRREAARQVARGLAGEISALVAIAELRQYVTSLRTMAQSAVPLRPSIRVTRNYFKVFDANADKVGLLGGDLHERVAAVYVRASAVFEDFATISAPEFVTWGLVAQKQLSTETATLLEETLALARETTARLRSFAGA
jgi:hypothetical protein